jgi:uncharacterized protein YgiM (DUF1202 family)
MKLNCWFILGAMLSTSVLAEQATNAPTAPDTAATDAKATQPAAAKTAQTPGAALKAAAAALRADPLEPGPATVIASNVNVRGQARLNSEIVGRLTKGDTVTVLEEVTLKNSKPDEPSAWAKILLPPDIRVWVHSMYLDANKTVTPPRLNVRGGPGENYSVLGLLLRGETVNQVSARGDWIQIEAPTNAYAFMAAQYLRQEPPAPVVAAVPVEPPTPAVVAEPPSVAPETTDTPPAPIEPPVVDVNEPPAQIEAPLVEEPPPPRIVQREGFVRGTVSIQAPTAFALISPQTGRTINYLYTSSTNLDLSRYKGLHIIVTGEEGLDERWKNTPVITIQRILVVN